MKDDNKIKVIPQMKRFGEDSKSRIAHQRIVANGIEFDSKVEHDRYLELLTMEQQGLISGLECHPVYDLIPTQKVPGKRSFRGHRYTADFRYNRNGETIVEDVKSTRSREERDYIINRKLMWLLLGVYVEEVVR